MSKKQHRFLIESFESDLNIYVFICNECCNQIISQSGKLSQRNKINFLSVGGGGGDGLPEKAVTDVLALVLGFSGVNFCVGIRLQEVTFVMRKVFGDFLN